MKASIKKREEEKKRKREKHKTNSRIATLLSLLILEEARFAIDAAGADNTVGQHHLVPSNGAETAVLRANIGKLTLLAFVAVADFLVLSRIVLVIDDERVCWAVLARACQRVVFVVVMVLTGKTDAAHLVPQTVGVEKIRTLRTLLTLLVGTFDNFSCRARLAT